MSAHIVFFQYYPFTYFGVSAIAAFLKSRGYVSDVVIDTLEQDAIRTLRDINPHLIGIPAMSMNHAWLVEKAKSLKQALPGAKIIVGGAHAILYSRKIMSEAPVDFVCNSDGEYVLESLLPVLRNEGRQWENIPGLCYRSLSGEIVCNERAQLYSYEKKVVEDHSVYYERYPFMMFDGVARFIASRGCSYDCSFCYNSQIAGIFSGKGSYIRYKPVETFLQEISRSVERYPVKSVYFSDDLFIMNKPWLSEFLIQYKEKIGLPFMCMVRSDLVDDDLARMLSLAGCKTACHGIETGNYRIRKEVLNKDITDEQIIGCGMSLKRHGISVQASNMFCLPDETLQDAFSTIELNIKAGTDAVFASLFMPFPDTQIARYCIDKGYLDKNFSFNDLPGSFAGSSILKLSEKEDLVNTQRLAWVFIGAPWFYRKAKWIVKIRWLSGAFALVFALGSLIRYKKTIGVSWMAALRYALRTGKYF